MAALRPDDIRERRSRAVKTALVLAAVAVTVFVAFLLSGILGSQ
jgi:hypothetical protein